MVDLVKARAQPASQGSPSTQELGPGAMPYAPGVTIGARMALGVLCLIPVGTAFVIVSGDRQAEIPWVQVGIVLLCIHLIASGLWSRRAWRPGLIAMSIGSLIPVALLHADVVLASFLLTQLAAGLIGGWAIASVWIRAGIGRWTTVDTGFVALGTVTMVQLVAALASPTDPSLGIHQIADVTWGRSNYVASVLVVLALAIWGRMKSTRAPKAASVLPLLMLLSAVVTLSRGAILALLAAGAFAAMTGFRQRPKHVILRLALIIAFSPILVLGYQQLTDVRVLDSSAQHIATNASARVILWGISVDMFLHSPVDGAGFGSLRDQSALQTGAAETYAHNIELSLAQQGGLLAAPLLATFAVCAVGALGKRGRRELAPAIVAALLVAQWEPLFEGTVGGMIAWAVIFASYFCAREFADEPNPIRIPQAARPRQSLQSDALPRDAVVPTSPG